MEYRFGVPDDLAMWREVAGDVGAVFRVPLMKDSPEFLEYARRKLVQRDSFLAYDPLHQRPVGFVGFSKNFNRITWLGVVSAYRMQGVGSKLLTLALAELNPELAITVKTFPADYPPGEAARRLYFKHGFLQLSEEILIEEGLEVAELTKLPSVILGGIDHEGRLPSLC